MELISLTAGSPAFVRGIVELLRAGKVLVVPTDTVYGFIADATNKGAVRRIFLAKGRGKKPLPVFVADTAMARHYGTIPLRVEPLLKTFWPGSLTVVVTATPNGLASAAVLGRKSLAVRVPDTPWLRRVVREFGRPLAQTSANISGMPPLASGRAVQKIFSVLQKARQPDVVIDGGYIRGSASTIIDCTAQVPRLLRAGKNARRIRSALSRIKTI